MQKPNTSPFEKLLSQISGQWTMYILWVLEEKGTLRFGQLKREVDGISTKVLTERLRMLESNGLVHRHYEPTVPPKVSYQLTEQGKELSIPLDQLCRLASRWYGDGDTTEKKAVPKEISKRN